MDRPFQLFSECMLFRDLKRREKEALFARVRIRDFAASKTIFVTGSPGDSLMIVLRGKVQINFTSPKGRSQVAMLSPGEIFGEIALLDGGPRTADAIAVTGCSLAILDRQDLLAFLELNRAAWQNMVSVLCKRLREGVAGVEEIAFLRDENLQLAEANHHKSRFLATASHDLRQPMHALGLFMAQLRSHMTSAEGSRLVDRIDEAVTGMNELFDALLDISKLDAGVLSTETAEFPIAQVFKRIEDTFAATACEKELSFRVMPSSAWVRSDRILLERIVLNLVSNAIRYTAVGGVVVGCRRRSETVRIEVWDTGPGIPEHQRRNIFGEFFSLAGRNTHGGLGLGLAIVDRLCGLLGHLVELASTVGKGSRFSITVPLAASQASVVEAHDPPPIATDVSSGKLVVVIDDDPLVLDGMGGLLRNWGCRVVSAASPNAILAGLHDVPDLIISDYRLADGHSGIKAIDDLRASFGAPIPAFLISGDTAPERLREAQESGHYLLHKPVRPMKLRAMLSQLLRNHSVAGAA